LEFTLKEIADRVGGKILGDDQVVVTGINSLQKPARDRSPFLPIPATKRLEKHKSLRDFCCRTEYRLCRLSGHRAQPGPGLREGAALFASLSQVWGVSEKAFVSESAVLGTMFPFIRWRTLGEMR